jgi:hypothetical protein
LKENTMADNEFDRPASLGKEDYVAGLRRELADVTKAGGEDVKKLIAGVKEELSRVGSPAKETADAPKDKETA